MREFFEVVDAHPGSFILTLIALTAIVQMIIEMVKWVIKTRQK